MNIKEIRQFNEELRKLVEDTDQVIGYKPFYGDVLAQVLVKDEFGQQEIIDCECFIEGKTDWAVAWYPDVHYKFTGNGKPNKIDLNHITKIELHGEIKDYVTPIKVIRILDEGNLEFGEGVRDSSWYYKS